MKRLYYCLVCIFSISLAMPVFGQVGKGLSGPHYNLNIIGVPKDKTVSSMTGSDRHTIFVPLSSREDVDRKIKIYYVRGEDFQVLDGNATDDNQATIQVPFESCGDYTTGCQDLLSYDVYSVGLGKPNGDAVVTPQCEYAKKVVDGQSTSELVCTDTLLLGEFKIKRSKGKPRRSEITDVFRATGCLDNNGNGICDTGDLEFDNIWIFNIEELSEYMWDYDNNGLKLMQTRFYPSISGDIGVKN